MDGVIQPTSVGSPAYGLGFKPVVVMSIDLKRLVARCRDSYGKYIDVRCDMMKSKGNLPVVGEQWMLDRPYGDWMFGAILNGGTDGVIIPPDSVTGLPETLQNHVDLINNVGDQSLQRDQTLFLLRPTGDIEQTIRSIPKPNTLLCQGQTVSRTSYSQLWSFAQQQNLVIGAPGVLAPFFGPGNGTTSFTLPDLSGMAVIGAGSAVALGAKVGADVKSIAQANLPAHNHNVTAATDSITHDHGAGGSHDHSVGDVFGVSVNATHGHAGPGVAQGPHSSAAIPQGPDSYAHTNGLHTHTAHTHSHVVTITQQNIGSNTPLDVRQASIGLNWLIWI